jgi:hypothetical protein
MNTPGRCCGIDEKADPVPMRIRIRMFLAPAAAFGARPKPGAKKCRAMFMLVAADRPTQRHSRKCR